MSVTHASTREEQWRRLYLTVRAKFLFALLIAVAWTALSVWLRFMPNVRVMVWR